MKIKDFEDFYDELCNNNSSEIKEVWEQAKIEEKKSNKIALIISIICDIIIAVFLFTTKKNMLSLFPFYYIFIVFGVLIFDLIILAITKLFICKSAKLYKKIFKERIIKGLINNFYDDSEYYANKGMARNVYNEAGYNEYYNRYYSDDYFEAKLNNKYLINMAEVETQRVETHTDSQGHTTTTTYTIFHGLFIKLLNEKSINCELHIGRGIFGKNKLEMDSPDFEKKFDVSCTNKIVGMQLLTADIMEEILDFNLRLKEKFDIIIRDSNIYIRFHCGTMFEPASLKKGVIDKITVKRYFDILKFTYEITNKFINIINETEI